MMLKFVAAVGATALLGGYVAFAAPAGAQPACGGGWSPYGGGNYCDGGQYWDGSYDHCVTVSVLGFGGTQCGRVCPPPPENPAVPAPWPGPGPDGRC
jgi:uncharacterized membrane protein